MAVTTRKKAAPRKQAAAPKPAPQVFPRFEIPEVSTPEEVLVALDELVEHVGLRRGMAQDAMKQQYWNGQQQALRQLRNLVVQLVDDDEGAN